MIEQPWRVSWRADPRAKVLADRHYNRQTPDAMQFVPPGRCLVLTTDAQQPWAHALAHEDKVVQRYTDCSVWRCPNCKVLIDDRPPSWGGCLTGPDVVRLEDNRGKRR